MHLMHLKFMEIKLMEKIYINITKEYLPPGKVGLLNFQWKALVFLLEYLVE